jgi:hypothetical protein
MENSLAEQCKSLRIKEAAKSIKREELHLSLRSIVEISP